jgi:hypothetical protein
VSSHIWDGHEATLESTRSAVRKVIDRMWADVVTDLPHSEDDPYVQAVRRQAEDAHARLFDLLLGMNHMLRAEAIRRSNQ